MKSKYTVSIEFTIETNETDMKQANTQHDNMADVIAACVGNVACRAAEDCGAVDVISQPYSLVSYGF